jgi:hypothetical protein
MASPGEVQNLIKINLDTAIGMMMRFATSGEGPMWVPLELCVGERVKANITSDSFPLPTLETYGEALSRVVGMLTAKPLVYRVVASDKSAE